ncbi:hypothetical protein EZJ43_16660 [Pedobacter changchengzhani]|uniref:Uncharacterized protein n=1 Tax=Pedobacter changchengzhani TaxID=2529274 RepID=A0A4R5MI83_9SPHI|nr:Imm26 family immunity protein [Pedobacter changchengzhani]TDG34805.1 hypothetical protein EZJ43_16660 [Pedobacter changchengzhani]
MTNPIDLKVFKIYLPDGDRNSFYIFGDLKIILGKKHQSDCIKEIRKSIKELNLKPQPTFNYSDNHSGIQSKNIETIILIIKKIKELSVDESLSFLHEEEMKELNQRLLNWEIPKRQKWKLGDIFSITLRDNSFAFGQIIGKTPTICIFKQKSKGLNISSLDKVDILTILHITPNGFNNWTYKIISNQKLLSDKDFGPTGSDRIRIGHQSYTSEIIQTVCDYHWFGISKWENPEEIEELIL